MNPIDEPLYYLRNEKNVKNNNLPITKREAFEGTIIFGATGSGKTSGSGHTIAFSLLKKGYGGIVLTVKKDECDQWKKYAKEANRENDLVIIEPGGNNTVDLIAFEYNQNGHLPGFAAQLTDILWNSSSVENPNSSQDSFWIEAPKLMLRHAIDIALYGKKTNPETNDETLTLQSIMDVILKAPSAENCKDIKDMLNQLCADDYQGRYQGCQSRYQRWINFAIDNLKAGNEDSENEILEQKYKKDRAKKTFDEWVGFVSNYLGIDDSWLKQISKVYKYVYFKEKGGVEPKGANDIDAIAAIRYWLYEYPSLPEETLQSIRTTIQSRLAYLLLTPFKELFFSNSKEKEAVNILHTFGVKDVDGNQLRYEEGEKKGYYRTKIIVLNVPQKVYHNTGVIAQTLFKQVWQRAAESCKRCIAEAEGQTYTFPAFLWADEAQFFITKEDNSFLQTARSSSIITVYLTQTIPNIRAKLDRSTSTYESDAFLANFQTIIFHANSCPATNEYAEKLFGKTLGSEGGDYTTPFSSNPNIDNSLRQINNSSQEGALKMDQWDSQSIWDDADQKHFTFRYQEVPVVRAYEFTELSSGGPNDNPKKDRIVTAIVYRRNYQYKTKTGKTILLKKINAKFMQQDNNAQNDNAS